MIEWEILHEFEPLTVEDAEMLARGEVPVLYLSREEIVRRYGVADKTGEETEGKG